MHSVVGAARDRLDLLGGGGGGGQHAPLLAGQGSNAGLLLRERGMLSSTNAALDEVMGTAQVGGWMGGQAGGTECQPVSGFVGGRGRV
jgi:hypothetical protein